MVIEGGFDFPIVEKVISEPYLSHVCLVLVCRVDFLNRKKLFGREVKPLPDFTESTSAQLFPFQISFNKRFILNLIFSEVGLHVTMMTSIVVGNHVLACI